MPIAAFGAIHLDTLARGSRQIARDTSTPARLSARPGGVAANVATAAARLGASATLVGRVGRDPEGDSLLARLAGAGVDTRAIGRSDQHPTGRYIALHDPDGTLAAAVVDSAITDALRPGDLDADAPSVADAGLWFLEANLPSPVLNELAARGGRRRRCLVADTVSRAKAPRLAALLPRLDLLLCNRGEAAALVAALRGEPGARRQADADLPPPAELAIALRAGGLAACVISDGAGPATLADATGIHTLATPSGPIVDVTGAGDALIAGTLVGLDRGWTLADAVRAGQAAGALALQAEGAAPPTLTWPAVETAMGRTA